MEDVNRFGEKKKQHSDFKLVITADGSHSIYNTGFDEHYHSTHGAYNESMHVFIEAGLRKALIDSPLDLNILEIGLGTGLNCFLSLVESIKTLKTNFFYHGIDNFLLDKELLELLNYGDLNEELFNQYQLFKDIINKNWDVCHALTNNFSLLKEKVSIQQRKLESKYHLIYFDAFGPNTQPEMWTDEVIQKMYDCLLPNGILVTYCAKGIVKRTLKKAGFIVETLSGPPGKREMTRANKKI